ncbi:hypothetical protein RvY_11278-2 [Ramazzottius varieornatus]|uniref:Uncharacterized protein n=1 Tax=Ramazzottius varieornatus TaxID=947166 RepID=A0A1D1VFN2_RAMVA|nr:hypothetical protein RvY_11278-2 [Ramazzottius varieornatus]
MLNRTFHLESRNVTIGADAFRLADVFFQRFNKANQQFQTAWQYDAITKVLLTTPEVAREWYGGVFPPPNKPACGYMRELCSDTDQVSKEFMGTLTKAACGTFGFLLLCLAAAVATFMPRWYTAKLGWWSLRAEEILAVRYRAGFKGRSSYHVGPNATSISPENHVNRVKLPFRTPFTLYESGNFK